MRDKEVALSANLLVALDKSVGRLTFAGQEGLFIEAEEPGVSEGKIQEAALQIKGQAQKAGKTVTMSASMNSWAAFIAKCQHQITAFHLPCETKGKPEERDYEPKNGGDNRNNREVYEGLARTPEVQEHVEAWLDEIAGRDTQSVDDQDDLKGGQ